MTSFGARDLALLLPDQVTTFSNSKEETVKFEALVPKIDQSKKIVRYFPGKAPIWNDQDEQETIISATIDRGHAEPPPIDRRLARLAKTVATNNETKPSRRVFEAHVVVDSDEEESPPRQSIRDISKPLEAVNETREDEDEITARRKRAAQKLREMNENSISSSAIADKIKNAISDDKEESEESDSEYDTDSEYSEDDIEILKPIFVPKALRETIKEQEQKEQEEVAKLADKHKLQEERRKETRQLVAESIRRSDDAKAAATDIDSEAGTPDDTDNLDDEVEYDKWKIREMTRLTRDASLREEEDREAADLIRRRNMTDEERLAEDTKLGRFEIKEKPKWNFMQKYYHKGVFYMDKDSLAGAEDVRTKDYSAPTLEDKTHKDQLPEVLQVKKFGMKGRTKYTHLVDQDTTNFAPGALRPDERVMETYMNKRSGVGNINTAGRLAKKNKP